jgi:Flp pilus assembly protein TadD
MNHKNKIKLGINLQDAEKYPEAIKVFLEILKFDKKNYLARINLSLCYFNTNQFEEASNVLHQLHVDYPEDFNALKFCGIAYSKMGNFSLAIEFFKRAIAKKSDDFDTWIEITKAAGANQQDIDAIYYATQTISLDPTKPIAHNNLGAAFMTIGKMDEALYCFETTLQLDPHNLMAKSNCSVIYEKRGDMQKAISNLEDCLPFAQPDSIQEAEIKFKMSLPLLFTGNLKRGWEMYDEGFKPKNTRTRTPKRHFDVPQWQGQPIQDKRLLVWGEQGIGDEIMFFRVLPDVFAHCDQITIECTPRLVSLFQRAFPKCHVRSHSVDSSLLLKPTHSDFDYHIPVGSLMRLFRNQIEQFKDVPPYIKVDPVLDEKFKTRLSKFKPKKLVGICWRSGKLAGDRNLNYAPLSAWETIFSVQDIQFVNLQYGDCSHELKQAQEFFGVNILNWDDVDLKDDQESLAAIINNLDCVISAGTAVAQLTGAVGKHLKLFTPRSWTLLGENEYPWASNVEAYISDVDEPVDRLLPEIAKSLLEI